MNEPMQPSIVADYERIAEDQMVTDTCDRCEAEVDIRLLDVVRESTGPYWLCPDCHATYEADVENYWSDIGEDIRDYPEPR